MARFWPKTRHNGRVMARKIFFHQCLWVTKFCAKFGHSRIPRTASAHKSFIILRCMWKEPAPFVPWDHMCGSPGGPREKTLRPKFSILGVFWPFRPQQPSPHPIAIQNMMFGRKKFFCGGIPLRDMCICRCMYRCVYAYVTAVKCHFTDWYELWALSDHEINYIK